MNCMAQAARVARAIHSALYRDRGTAATKANTVAIEANTQAIIASSDSIKRRGDEFSRLLHGMRGEDIGKPRPRTRKGRPSR